MLTSNQVNDRYSFHITKDMLVKPSNKEFSQARLHLVSYVTDKEIISNTTYNKMKRNAVNKLVQYIAEVSLVKMKFR